MATRRTFLKDLSVAATAAGTAAPMALARRMTRGDRLAWLRGRTGIMLGPNPGLVERTAAAELRALLARECGVDLPVRVATGSDPDIEGMILLTVAPRASGPTDQGESFQLLADGATLRISGSEPVGVLQGVFGLERWLTDQPDGDPASLRIERTARFKFRAAMPYFTEPGAVTDEYLRFLASSGYNMLYLEFHPFKKYIDDPLPFPISQILRIRDFVNAPGHARLVEYGSDLFARAKRYGLDGHVYVMEPWGGDAEFVRANPDALGRNRKQHFTQPLCLDSAVARDYLRELTATMVRSLPDLKGMIVMSEDGTTICDDSCPRSSGPRSERRARLFTTLSEGGKSVRPDFRVVPYSWWWDAEDFPAVIRAIPADSLICTRAVTRAPYRLDDEWQGSPGDVSLLVDGPGRDFEEAVRLGRERGIAVVDMLPISNGHELITMPSMPAPDRYARKLDILEQAGGAGWIGYDCGGATPTVATSMLARALWGPAPSVEAQVQTQAVATYGRSGAERAVEGWRQTSAALRWLPIELDRTADHGIRAGATISAMAPLVPITLARAYGYRLFPKGAEAAPMESLTQGHWLAFFRHRSLMLRYLDRLRGELAAGVSTLEEASRLAPTPRRRAAGEDVRGAQATLSTVDSALHLLRFWDQLARIPAAKTPDAQAAIIAAVTGIVTAERENTRRMLGLVRRDPRLFYCACTKYVHPDYISGGFLANGFYTDRMTVPEMLEAKLAAIETEDFAGQLKRAFSGCCADLINWGVRP